MRIRITVFVTALAAIFAASAFSLGRKTDYAEVRVGSYNIRMSGMDKASPDNNWSVRKERLWTSIENCRFDVFGLHNVIVDERETVEHFKSRSGLEDALVESCVFVDSICQKTQVRADALSSYADHISERIVKSFRLACELKTFKQVLHSLLDVFFCHHTCVQCQQIVQS